MTFVSDWMMVLTSLRRAAVVAASLFTAFLSEAASVYVDRAVPSSGDGKTWETAFQTIQEGIRAAANEDEVVVAAGTYIETIDFEGKPITVRSTDPADPRVVTSTVIEASGFPEVVRFRSSETEAAVIAGFTITGGQVGVSCVWSSPRIRNNIIEANHAGFDEGGGLSCYYSSPAIENNIIASNFAAGGGAGIACEGGRPIIVGNLVIGNVTDMEGGGVLCTDSEATIERNRFIGNNCQGNGGAISVHGSKLHVMNNLLVSNVANAMGGAIACYDSVMNGIGNTIANNTSQGGGAGGIHFLISSGTVCNSILWANGDDISGCQASFCCLESDDPENEGEGNIHADPAFADPAGADTVLGTEDDDYRLSADSPCIDKGSFSVVVTLSAAKLADMLTLCWDPGTDLPGESRVSGFAPDMGCYEYQGQPAAYVLESSHDLQEWSAIHVGPDTSLVLAPFPSAPKTFFRLSLM